MRYVVFAHVWLFFLPPSPTYLLDPYQRRLIRLDKRGQKEDVCLVALPRQFVMRDDPSVGSS